MGFFNRISSGLHRSRDKFKEQMNILLDRGPDVDEEFWETLEEALILSDFGAAAADAIVEELRDEATRKALPDAYAVLDLLAEKIADQFIETDGSIFDDEAVVLFVGVNGSGKTTTVGKIAAEAHGNDRKVLLGSADTFRAAAIEQLEEWARRADVEIVSRERGSDPASVCYETLERAEQTGADLVLIDTAGRLHTSDDLMRELTKVVEVVRQSFGAAGLHRARHRCDHWAERPCSRRASSTRRSTSMASSSPSSMALQRVASRWRSLMNWNCRSIKIGVAEGIEDLQDFDALDFANALIGELRDAG